MYLTQMKGAAGQLCQQRGDLWGTGERTDYWEGTVSVLGKSEGLVGKEEQPARKK